MENDKIVENFKVAISSTVKAIAKKHDLNIVFSDSSEKQANSIQLPKIESQTFKDYENIRALADSEALKIKHSDAKLLRKYEPQGTLAKNIYKSAEKIRYEKLGSLNFAGIEHNFRNFYQKKFKEQQDSLFINVESAFDIILANQLLKLDLKLDQNKTLKNWDSVIRDKIGNKFK